MCVAMSQGVTEPSSSPEGSKGVDMTQTQCTISGLAWGRGRLAGKHARPYLLWTYQAVGSHGPACCCLHWVQACLEGRGALQGLMPWRPLMAASLRGSLAATAAHHTQPAGVMSAVLMVWVAIIACV